MPQPRRLLPTTILGLCALLSLAFAPAVSPEAESQAEQAGKCLEGYAYAETIVGAHGITNTWCIHPTNCTGDLRVGPGSDGTNTVKAHYYVSVPLHTGTDVGCYL